MIRPERSGRYCAEDVLAVMGYTPSREQALSRRPAMARAQLRRGQDSCADVRVHFLDSALGPQESRDDLCCSVVVTVIRVRQCLLREGLADVFHQQKQMQRVGWAELEVWHEVEVEGPGFLGLAVDEEPSAPDFVREAD